MMQKFKQLFARNSRKKDFSWFFNHASDKAQKRLMEEIARKANQDQRDLMRRYEEAHQQAK